MPRLTYPRAQQFRRLGRASRHAAASAAAAVLGALALRAGMADLGAVLLVAAVGLGTSAPHWWRLTARSAVGAESERQVHRALDVLEHDGWRVRHSLDWPGRGDIDIVALAPTGTAFVIEIKTARFTAEHLARVREMARVAARAAAPLVSGRGEHVRAGRAPKRVGHDEDDATEPAIPHARREGLRKQQRRLDVDRLNHPPHVQAKLVERLDPERGGRVDQDVASTVALEHDLSRAPHVVRVAEINSDLAGAVEHGHGVIARQSVDDRPADRARATGHHRDTATRAGRHR